MAKTKLSLQEQAKEVLKQAEERGVSSNFFFVNSFCVYLFGLAPVFHLKK